MTEGLSRGASGGAANEAGGEYRRAVAAFFVAYGLRGLPAPLDLPSDVAIVRSVRLEVDRRPDDVEVELVRHRALIQAKAQLSRAALREAAPQLLEAVRRPDFSPEVDRLVIVSGKLRKWGETLASLLNAERDKERGARSQEEKEAIGIFYDALGLASEGERELVRRATEIVRLELTEELYVHAQAAIGLLDGNVVPEGLGLRTWRELIRLAGSFARDRSGGSMDVWRSSLRGAGVIFRRATNDYLPDDPVAASLDSEPLEFVNRESELRRLDEVAATIDTGTEYPVVALISGMPGVGKTSIGRHWARLNQHRFTHGELAVDLSKHRSKRLMPPAGPTSTGVATTDAAEHHDGGGLDLAGVLGALLEDLGVKSYGLPPDPGGRSDLFRSLTTSRKLLVRVDNVFYPTEVSPLLPGGAGSMVIITANRNVQELQEHAQAVVELNPLDPRAALDLLKVVVGEPERVHAEQTDVDELVRICGGLPIAISVCGRWLAANRQRTVSKLVGRLTDPARAPRALAVPGDPSLDRVFDVAYEDLAPYPALLYRRLGVHPGVEVDRRIAAILADVSIPQAATALEVLRSRYLVERLPRGRFQMHSRVRAHSRKAAVDLERVETREQTIRRLVDWYYAAARQADRMLNADRLRIDSEDEVPARDLPELLSPEDAVKWFDLEGANILAVLQAAHLREWDDRVWSIVEALWNFYHARRSDTRWREAHRLAVESVFRNQDLAALAQMHKQASRLHAELRELDKASAHLQEAFDAVTASGHRALKASIVEFRGSLRLDTGDTRGALRDFRAARRMFERLDIPRGVAIQDLLIGSVLIQTGAYRRAQRPLRRTLAFMRRIGDDMLEARSLLRLGEALNGIGDVEEAEQAASAALELTKRLRFRVEEAEAFELQARIASSAGDAEATYSRWQRAHQIYREIGHPRAVDVSIILTGLEQGLRPTG